MKNRIFTILTLAALLLGSWSSAAQALVIGPDAAYIKQMSHYDDRSLNGVASVIIQRYPDAIIDYSSMQIQLPGLLGTTYDHPQAAFTLKSKDADGKVKITLDSGDGEPNSAMPELDLAPGEMVEFEDHSRAARSGSIYRSICAYDFQYGYAETTKLADGQVDPGDWIDFLPRPSLIGVRSSGPWSNWSPGCRPRAAEAGQEYSIVLFLNVCDYNDGNGTSIWSANGNHCTVGPARSWCPNGIFWYFTAAQINLGSGVLKDVTVTEASEGESDWNGITHYIQGKVATPGGLMSLNEWGQAMSSAPGIGAGDGPELVYQPGDKVSFDYTLWNPADSDIYNVPYTLCHMNYGASWRAARPLASWTRPPSRKRQ